MLSRRHFLTRTLPGLALAPALVRAQPGGYTTWTFKLKPATLPATPGFKLSLRLYHSTISEMYALTSDFSVQSPSARELILPAKEGVINLRSSTPPQLLLRFTYQKHDPRDTLVYEQANLMTGSSFRHTCRDASGAKVIFSCKGTATVTAPKTVEIEIVPHNPVAS